MKRCTMTIASTAAALLCLALPGCSTNNAAQRQSAPVGPSGAAADTTQAVQLVNGVPITRAEVERATKVLLAQSGTNQPLGPEAIKKVNQTALDQLTLAELLYQEAAKLEVKDLDRQVEQKIEESKAQYPSPSAFEDALKGSGLTVAEMSRNARKSILINTLIEERFVARVEVTEGEAEKFYQENREKYFNRPENARASHILVKVEMDDTAERKKQAREKAEALLKRVKGGDDFAEVARTESSCPSKAVGGDLGNFGRGQMVPPFEEAVFAMKPGEISDVVESSFGFHIIKLSEKNPAAQAKYEDVKTKIVQYLKDEKVRKLVAAYVEELKSKAKITRV